LEEESMSDRDSVISANESSLVEESLVEEVSIDGMCGVY
jgi:mycofactocin precursor peptide MftA